MLKTSRVVYSRQYLHKLPDPNPPQVGTDSIVCSSWREGIQNPGYKGKIASHVDATTPMTAYTESVKMEQQGIIRFSEYGNRHYHSDKGGFQYSSLRTFEPLSDSASESYAKAAADYYGQLSSLRKDISGQQALAELGKTIEFLKSPFRSGIDLLVQALQKGAKVQRNNRYKAKGKGRRKAPAPQPSLDGERRIARNIGGQWLEIRFGLLPLLYDIKGVMDTLKRKASGIDVRQYKAYGQAERSKITRTEISDLYGVSLLTDKILVRKSKTYFHFGYMHKILNDVDARISAFEEGFLDIRDLPSTVWEITPFSWLVDYWINIGSIIEATFADVSNVVYVSKSVIDEYKQTFHVHTPRPLASRFVVTEFSPWVASFTSRHVTRTSGPVGIPPLVLTRPRSPIQLLNMAALLAGNLKRSTLRI